MNEFIGRACSIGFVSGDVVWIDGTFCGVVPVVVGEEAVGVMFCLKDEKGSEYFITSDSLIGLEFKAEKKAKTVAIKRG